ncbi:MAG: LCP family protein [Clostridia bacterium]|nr:LCP family protein [Clostridia bacterium]
MHKHRHDRRYYLIRFLFIVIIAAVVVGVLLYLDYQDQAKYQETRGTMSEGFGDRATVSVQGKQYYVRDGIFSTLLLGTDVTAESTSPDIYRSGGQADFLLLVVRDSTQKKVSLLQIDRNTIADVMTLSILGKEAGTRKYQVCLAHAFGKTRQDNCQYTVDAVERLLEGVTIDGYVSMDLKDIPAFNHAIGGVDVEIEDDFTAFDPAMYVGASLHLTDDQAALFTHSRMSVGDGTNTSRMRRHRAYMNGAIAQIRSLMASDAEYASSLLDSIYSILFTNLSKGRIINELNMIYSYDLGEIQTPAGINIKGSNGLVEFHVDEDRLIEWILETYYEPIEERND